MQRNIRVGLAAVIAMAWVSSATAEANWPTWRGPNGNGVVEGNPPTKWSEDANVKWKVKLPGLGLATPVVWGDRMYIQTAVAADAPPSTETQPAPQPRGDQPRPGRRGGGGRGSRPMQAHKFMLLAVDRHTGKTVWEKTLAEKVPHEGAHQTASMASNSPVTDGKHIYGYFGSRGLHCLDMDGNIVWQKDLGEMRMANSFGEGSSPALRGDTLIVNCDQEDDSVLYAFDAKTGQQKWKVDRDERTSWSTPVIVDVDGKPQVIISASNNSAGYDLATGKLIWKCSGLGSNVIPTPLYADGVVYVMSGHRSPRAQAIRIAGQSETLDDTDAVLWSTDRGTPYVPSPILHNGVIYYLSGNTGTLSAVDAATGSPKYPTQRLEGVNTVYSSLVMAGGNLYVTDRFGTTVVLKPGDSSLETVAVNKLDDGFDASMVVVGDTIYLRGRQNLYCIAEK